MEKTSVSVIASISQAQRDRAKKKVKCHCPEGSSSLQSFGNATICIRPDCFQAWIRHIAKRSSVSNAMVARLAENEAVWAEFTQEFSVFCWMRVAEKAANGISHFDILNCATPFLRRLDRLRLYESGAHDGKTLGFRSMVGRGWAVEVEVDTIEERTIQDAALLGASVEELDAREHIGAVVRKINDPALSLFFAEQITLEDYALICDKSIVEAEEYITKRLLHLRSHFGYKVPETHQSRKALRLFRAQQTHG